MAMGVRTRTGSCLRGADGDPSLVRMCYVLLRMHVAPTASCLPPREILSCSINTPPVLSQPLRPILSYPAMCPTPVLVKTRLTSIPFQQDTFIILTSSCTRGVSIPRLFGGKPGGYHRVGSEGRGRGRDGAEDENRLIDSLDESWD